MPEEPVLSPEMLLPRLGDILIEKGIVHQQDLDLALCRQKELRDHSGNMPLLGQVLIDMGIIDRPTLERIITEQIINLKNALLEANQNLELRVLERTRELQQALEKLSELNKLKANFIANISHELRTPLTHIKGYLDILVNGDLGELSNEQSHVVSVMQRSSARLEKLIEDLINFSLTERGHVFLNRHPATISHICEFVIKKMEAEANSKNVRLTLSIQEKLPLVDMDTEKIQWVFVQLIENAIKFSPPGSSVDLVVQQFDNAVEISVMDNGIGIPQDRITEIFEPFHQLDGSSTRRYGGTGLGLALANKIIEAHGSCFSVTSSPGKGSVFKFSLPKASLL